MNCDYFMSRTNYLQFVHDFVEKFLGDFAKVTVIRFDEVDKELSEYYSRYLIK